MDYKLAIGDIVSDIGGDNAILDFQPAAGVECVLPFMTAVDTQNFFNLHDGVITSRNLAISATLMATKLGFFIDNTRFMRLTAAGVGRRNAFTGIETNI